MNAIELLDERNSVTEQDVLCLGFQLTRLPIWQLDPKSMILMALLLGLQRRMFSGLRSQWIICSSGVDRYSNARQSCCANLRVKFRETPRKLVLRRRSYRLYESSSNTKHKWFLHIKWRFRRTGKRTKT